MPPSSPAAGDKTESLVGIARHMGYGRETRTTQVAGRTPMKLSAEDVLGDWSLRPGDGLLSTLIMTLSFSSMPSGEYSAFTAREVEEAVRDVDTLLASTSSKVSDKHGLGGRIMS